MEREQVRTAVRATLLLLRRISQRTRTPADDLVVGMLQANEGRLVEAVSRLLERPGEPTDEQITAALQAVGIKV